MNKNLGFYVRRYFSSYLIGQHNYGKNTVASYRNTFRLLLTFLDGNHQRKKNIPISDVDKTCILRFLSWLDTERENSLAKNVRLARLKYTVNPESRNGIRCIMQKSGGNA